MRYATIDTASGPMSLAIPNTVMEGAGFYVSHNDHDTALYGCETTALVLGQMERFYILKGDHRRQYAERIPLGFDACMDYFRANACDIHPRSDKTP
ncbi:hypothetical protein J1C51_24000 [Chromobacterium haemolyticum]|uniref:hypothetical protein n=1 Tax=Chromobacterium haemolyticum TaxID=394935 RepID=UPI001A92296D|nr:hypothetical protein [Chromobacterium haemolyticum]MBO0501839.1 hypothetical protein [Chromobacterium haemolyticum]